MLTSTTNGFSVPVEQVAQPPLWNPPIRAILRLFLRHPTMRKIERLMNAAITASKDFKLDNTEVVACSNVSDVYLHGNLIARIGETWIELFDGGRQSATTKSRLNAILSEHGIPGECVFQKNFQWFVNYNGQPIPFFSGMRMA